MNPTPRKSGGQIQMKVLVLAGGGLIVLGILVAIGAYYQEPRATPQLEIAATASQTERLEKIDQWLVGLHKSGEFNGGVLIARAGEPLLMQTYGYADVDSKRLLTTQTPFRLASVSKQFTAAGILRLVEKGQAELDQPVSQLLAGFPFERVTLRHLLNQTSGIPDVYMQLGKQHRKEIGDVLRIQDVADLLSRYPPKAEPPGDEHKYSNTNYVLLAAVIEAVSQMTYEDFMQEELFKPLGMRDTRVWNRVSTQPNFPERAEDFYTFFGRKAALPMTWIDGVAGDGAVFCSLRDFLIWDAFWNGNSLVADDLLSQAFTRPKLNDDSLSYYGFGWVLSSQPGRVWHNGGWLGARTYIMRDAVSKQCLVVLDNSSNEKAETIAREIQAQLFTQKKQYGDAPRVSPFTDVRFDNGQVMVTFDGQPYRWLELDGFQVDDIVSTAKLHFGDDWQKRVAEDLVAVLWRMDHRPGDTVGLRLQKPDAKQDIVIEKAAMTKGNRFATVWNREHADEEVAYAQEDTSVDYSDLPIDNKLRARLVGRYELNPDFIFDVQDRQGRLMVGITKQQTRQVFPDSATHWSYQGIKATLEFKLGETGPAYELVLHQNGIRQHAKRIGE